MVYQLAKELTSIAGLDSFAHDFWLRVGSISLWQVEMDLDIPFQRSLRMMEKMLDCFDFPDAREEKEWSLCRTLGFGNLVAMN